MRRDQTRRDGMRWDGMGWDETRRDETRRDACSLQAARSSHLTIASASASIDGMAGAFHNVRIVSLLAPLERRRNSNNKPSGGLQVSSPVRGNKLAHNRCAIQGCSPGSLKPKAASLGPKRDVAPHWLPESLTLLLIGICCKSRGGT